MTALPEGEHEINNSTNDPVNDDNSTIEPKKHGENVGEYDDVELVEFLEKMDLMDMKEEILSSKLKLVHFKEVEKSDLDALCEDLQLKPGQKIRLKHAIKTLQKRMVRRRIREKMKSKVLSSKKKVMNLKNKRMPQQKSNMIPKDDMKHNDKANDAEDDHLRQLRSKIVIVGEAAVGKTTLQKAMMGYDFEHGSKATFAVSSTHHKSQYKHNKYDIMVDYEIFDTPGLDRFADIITLYLRGALAVIVVFDVSNPKSFEKAKWWIDYIENNASGYDKIILIANKIDIANEPGHDQQSDDDEDEEKEEDDDTTLGGGDDVDIIKKGRLYATEHGVSFLEISAKTKDNIDVLLSWLDTQSKKKVANNPQMIEKKNKAIQLHEGLISGRNKKRYNIFDKFDNFDFDYSKCCAF